MVLQRSPHRAVIWGYGIVGANITVVLNDTKYTTNVTRGPINYGVWKVKLDAQKAGGPFDVMAYHDIFGFTSKIKLKNVLFGDVWVCSGQSNMQLTLSMAFNMSDELRIASSYNQVRLFTVGDLEFKLPLYDLMSIVQPWSIPSADTLAGPPWTYFSAVCWMYGRRLHDVLGVPVGLISSAFAGSTIEAWISSDALQKCCPNIPNW
uniref:Sialate O-acetylesterase domain-containing protein n=1 Tax=Ciona savignyi TaxID=51511 RepID=H2ZGF8_CIOSA